VAYLQFLGAAETVTGSKHLINTVLILIFELFFLFAGIKT